MGGDQFRFITLEHSLNNFEFGMCQMTCKAPPIGSTFGAGVAALAADPLDFTTENLFDEIIAGGANGNCLHIS